MGTKGRGGGERDQRERETKFEVPDEWLLPSLDGALPAGASVAPSTARLESTYFDTPDRALLANGVTLRRRSGDIDNGWHLKVPDGAARLEIHRPLAGGRGVPEALRNATQGVRAGAALRPIATLVTDRDIHRVVAGDGTALAEIVVDSVTASELREFTVSRHWREVEVELIEGDERLLRRIGRWLTKQGAMPAGYGSKLARALDVAGDEPRDSATLAGLIGGYLDRQHQAIIRGDVDLRRGVDAAATVHATRVATRRYRSVLRVFGAVFDAERAAALDAELRWYAGMLGDVRDLHVLGAHLKEQIAGLPAELVLGPVAARVDQAVAKDLAEASARLQDAMRSRRYYALLRELQSWRADLPVVSNAPAKRVPDYLHQAERKVAKRAKRVGDGTDLDASHSLRKATKRLRYAAELAEPAIGKAAKKQAKQAKAQQKQLGDRQDARVAVAFLYRLGTAAGAAGENGFTYGLLYERERERSGA